MKSFRCRNPSPCRRREFWTTSILLSNRIHNRHLGDCGGGAAQRSICRTSRSRVCAAARLAWMKEAKPFVPYFPHARSRQ